MSISHVVVINEICKNRTKEGKKDTKGVDLFSKALKSILYARLPTSAISFILNSGSRKLDIVFLSLAIDLPMYIDYMIKYSVSSHLLCF